MGEYQDNQEELQDQRSTVLEYMRASNEWSAHSMQNPYIPPSAFFEDHMRDRAMARRERREARARRHSGHDGSGPSGS